MGISYFDRILYDQIWKWNPYQTGQLNLIEYELSNKELECRIKID